MVHRRCCSNINFITICSEYLPFSYLPNNLLPKHKGKFEKMPTISERKVLAIMPHFSAGISFVCSFALVQGILRDPKKRKQVYSQFILFASIYDLLVSIAYFMGTWPIPPDPEKDIQFTVGNYATCNAQGFFIQIGIGSIVYYVGLALYYLLVLKYRWSEDRLAIVLKVTHCVSWTLSLGTSIAALFLGLFNEAALWCWISSFPSGCANTRSGDAECERGDHAWVYRWAFYYSPLWFSIIMITILTGMTTYSVVHSERKSRKWRQGGVRADGTYDVARSTSHKVFVQNLHYVLAFYVTWTFPTLLRVKDTMGDPIKFWLSLCMTIFLPLQGLWNCTVYFRPRYNRLREEMPDESFLSVFLRTFFGTTPTRKVLVRKSVRVKKKPQPTETTTWDIAVKSDHVENSDVINNDDEGEEEKVEKEIEVEEEEDDADVMNPSHKLLQSYGSNDG